MSDFQVTPSVLRSNADQLSELNARFKSSIDSLVTSESALNAMWDGEANDAFHGAFMTDKGKMDEFSHLIEQYTERLRQIAIRYEQTEQNTTSIASSRTY